MDSEYKKFVREVKEGNIRHGYLLLGENDFLKDYLAREIENKIIKPDFTVTDRLLVYGDSVQSDVISWLNSPPFGSKKKLLIIKEAEKVSQKIRASLQRWLDNPSKTAVLVLMANPSRHGTGREKNGFKNIPTCKCWKLFERELPEWIRSFVKEREFSIESEAIGFLQQIFATDIQALSGELEKLMNFVEPRKVIRLKETQEMESQEITGSVFDLTHAVADRDFDKASLLLKLLFELGESKTILWKIYDHFDKLLRLKNNPEESQGIHKYYLPKYKHEASLWTENDLLNSFSYLLEADLAIKTGKAKLDFVLEELIYKLCSPALAGSTRRKKLC